MARVLVGLLAAVFLFGCGGKSAGPQSALPPSPPDSPAEYKGPMFAYVKGGSVISQFLLQPDGGVTAATPSAATQPGIFSISAGGSFIATAATKPWSEEDQYVDRTQQNVDLYRVGGAGELTPVAHLNFPAELGYVNGPSLLQFSPDGKFLYVGSGPNEQPEPDSIFAFRVDQGSGALTLLPGFPTYFGIGDLTMSPDGKWLCGTGFSRTGVGFFVCGTPQPDGSLANVAGHAFGYSYVTGFGFSPDSKYLFVGGDGKFVKVFEVAQYRFVEASNEVSVGCEPECKVYAEAFDQTGKWAFANSITQRSLYVLRFDRAKRLLEQVGPPVTIGGSYAQFRYSPTGHLLVPVEGGLLRVFRFNSESGSLTEVQGSPFLVGGNGTPRIALKRP